MRTTTALLIAIVAPLIGAIANAQITYTTQTCTMANQLCYETIEGLEVDGKTYKVELVGGSFEDVFAGELPEFWGRPDLAAEAGLALSRAVRSIGLSDQFYSLDADICISRCPDGTNIPFADNGADPDLINECYVPVTPQATEIELVRCDFTSNRFASLRENYAVFTEIPQIVAIDIRPRKAINKINPASSRNVSVALMTSETFDATQIDPMTVRFGPAGAIESDLRSRVRDIDGDGDADVVLQFCVSETGIQCGDTEATLIGITFDGDDFQGTDSVTTIGCPK